MPPNRAEAEDNRAIDLLRALEIAGYFQQPNHVRELRDDADLDSLRKRGDFRALLDEVVGASPKPAKKN